MAQEIKYKPEYCKRLVEWMAQGYSYSTFSTQLDVVPATLYNWEKEYPEWVAAKEKGVEAGKTFLEGAIIKGVNGLPQAKHIKENSAQWLLKTRHHKEYGDKQKIEHAHSLADLIEQAGKDE